MAELDDLIGRWHRQLAKVTGEMSQALTRRRMKKDAISDWCERIQKVLDEMEDDE